MEVTKLISSRLYPVLVWGALMGLAVHAGLKSQFMHQFAETEQISLIDNASASVSAHLYTDEDASDRTTLP